MGFGPHLKWNSAESERNYNLMILIEEFLVAGSFNRDEFEGRIYQKLGRKSLNAYMECFLVFQFWRKSSSDPSKYVLCFDPIIQFTSKISNLHPNLYLILIKGSNSKGEKLAPNVSSNYEFIWTVQV